MNFDGKKSERVLMSATPEMQKAVEALATLHDLPANRVYRAFIRYGLKQVRVHGFHEIYREEVQPTATSANPASELSVTGANQLLPSQLLLPNTGAPVPVKKRRVG